MEDRWCDLLCGRALHVVLVGASVIEPENRIE